MDMKYKKIAVIGTMITLSFGMLTLSIKADKTKAQLNINDKIKGIKREIHDGEVEGYSLDDGIDTASITPGSTPTPTPEPTPFPIYDLEKDAVKGINKLITDYYAAKIECNVEKLKELCNDDTVVKNEETLRIETEYIEDYRNLTVYSKKGMEEDSYIVYVYHEIKFTGVNTLAPGLSKFYVTTNEEDKFVIVSGTLDEEVAEYNAIRNDDEDVQKLIKRTKKLGDEAQNKDNDLAEFWRNIDKVVNKNNDSQEEKDSSKQADAGEEKGSKK